MQNNTEQTLTNKMVQNVW